MKHTFLFPYSIKKPALVLLALSLSLASYIMFIDNDPDFFNAKTYDKESGYTILGYWMDICGMEEGFRTGEKSDEYHSENHYYEMGSTIVGSLLILSLLLFAFSKEKHEDEYIQKMRLDALLWATYINYGLLLIAFWVFWNFDFLNVMMYNMFTHLLIFIIRFNYLKYKQQLSLKHEE